MVREMWLSNSTLEVFTKAVELNKTSYFVVSGIVMSILVLAVTLVGIRILPLMMRGKYPSEQESKWLVLFSAVVMCIAVILGSDMLQGFFMQSNYERWFYDDASRAIHVVSLDRDAFELSISGGKATLHEGEFVDVTDKEKVAILFEGLGQKIHMDKKKLTKMVKNIRGDLEGQR